MSTSGRKPDPGLYLVSTPIGNLRDITLRALDILGGVDRIACEDTRVTGRLLAHYGIKRPLTAYHDHNAERVRPDLLRRLEAGDSIALVSDAGTPGISDPGVKLVAATHERGIAVAAIPGASALTAALAAAGLPTDRVLFAGFPPAKAAARRKLIGEMARVRASLVFYEAPHRLAACLADLAEGLGAREAALCRELTKLHEEVRRGTLVELAAAYSGRSVKGEIVLVVAPPAEVGERAAESEADAALREALKALSVREAAAAVAWLTGLPRRRLYKRALEIRGEHEEE